MSFCGDLNFRNQVIKTLYGSLPTNLQNGIAWRYDQMRSNLCLPAINWPPYNPPNHGVNVMTNTPDVLLEVNQSLFNGVSCLNPIWAFPRVGHDLPTWMDTPINCPLSPQPDTFDFSKKKIMIICQDPLRNNRCTKGNIYISSVFGLHSTDWRRMTSFTANLINSILGNGCCIYLTDYNKLYVDGKKISNFGNNFPNKFRNMLDQEIDLFKPDKIITMGKNASDALLGQNNWQYFPSPVGTTYPYTSNGRTYPVVPVYHTNWRMPKQYYLSRGYQSKKDIYVDYMK